MQYIKKKLKIENIYVENIAKKYRRVKNPARGLASARRTPPAISLA